MRIKPLLVCMGLLALASCASTVDRGPAPPVSSLYSAFSYKDGDISFYAPFLAATEAHHNERHSTSASYYLQALNMDPDSKFVADRAFFQLLFAGRMREAARVAGKIRAEDQESADDDLVQLVYVLEAFERGDWQAVQDRLTHTMSTGFGYILTPIIEAWAKGASGDIDAAKAALQPLWADERLKTIADEHLAYILDYRGKYEEAKKQYMLIANERPPFSLQPFISYTYMLYRQGHEDAARDFLGEQAKRFQNHSFLLREGAQILSGGIPTHEANTPRGAVSMVFYRLANEFTKAGSEQTAIVYLRIASFLTPEVPDIYFSLGSLLEKVENADAAVAAYKAIPPSSPFKRVADLRRIEVLKSVDRMVEAETLIRNALVDNPDQFDFLLSMADLLQRQEAFEASLEYYNRAIVQIRKPEGDDWRVFFARGVSYERAGNWQLAEKDLQVALTLSEEQPSVLNYLGYSWIDRGQNIELAKDMIKRAVKARPDDGFIVDSLGWVHFLTGNYVEAVETLERAVRLEPGDVTINEHLGDAYWRVGRKVEARFQWRHALDGKLKPEERSLIKTKLDKGLPDIPADAPSPAGAQGHS